MNTSSSLRSFTVPGGSGASESGRLVPDNKPLQTDERRVLVIGKSRMTLCTPADVPPGAANFT